MLDSKDSKGLSKEEFKELSEIRTQIAWCEECIADINKKANSIRERSNLGKRFMTRTFDTFEVNADNEMAYHLSKKCAEMIISHKPYDRCGLVITGNNGIGKTHLSASIANKCIDEGVTTLFSTFTDILNAEKKRINGEANAFDPTVPNCELVPLLIVDDLGKEKTTEWSNEVLFKIINSRYEAMRPTIITTNMSLADMYKSLDKAVFSRLYEMCKIVEINGNDKRMEK